MNRFIDINPERCIGCGTCQSACADAHRMQGLQDTPRLALVKTGGISAALACHHCEGAPCAEVCPVNAIEHDGDRIHVKEQECIGCRLCAVACPFGAIHPDGTSIAGVAGMCDPTPSYPKSLSSLLTCDNIYISDFTMCCVYFLIIRIVSGNTALELLVPAVNV